MSQMIILYPDYELYSPIIFQFFMYIPIFLIVLSLYNQTNMDRKLWTQQEDQAISLLVQQHGNKKWALISQHLPTIVKGSSRTGKQCRQRWYNHLNPDVRKQTWTQSEQEIMFEAHKKYGNKWKQISRLLQGRTDNSIKNHFYSTLRRSLRRINKYLGSKNSTNLMRDLKPCVLSKVINAKTLIGLEDFDNIQGISDLPSLLFEFSNFKPVKQKLKKSKQDKQLPQEQKEQLSIILNKVITINEKYSNTKRFKKQNKEHSQISSTFHCDQRKPQKQSNSNNVNNNSAHNNFEEEGPKMKLEDCSPNKSSLKCKKQRNQKLRQKHSKMTDTLKQNEISPQKWFEEQRFLCDYTNNKKGQFIWEIENQCQVQQYGLFDNYYYKDKPDEERIQVQRFPQGINLNFDDIFSTKQNCLSQRK